jgi:hypothetical protein
MHLVRSVIDRQITLLIAYDSEYPEPLHSKRPIPDCAGVALLLTPPEPRARWPGSPSDPTQRPPTT